MGFKSALSLIYLSLFESATAASDLDTLRAKANQWFKDQF